MRYDRRTLAPIVFVGAGILLPTFLALFNPLLFASADQLRCGSYLNNFPHLWNRLIDDRVFETLRPCTVAALHGIVLLQLLLIVLGWMLVPGNPTLRWTETKTLIPVIALSAFYIAGTWLDFAFTGWTIEGALHAKHSRTLSPANWCLVMALCIFLLGVATTAVVTWIPILLRLRRSR